MESQSLAQHSAKDCHHYTPLDWWGRIMQMGTVHTDPCTDESAVVKPEITHSVDGETSRWIGNVYCNPPGTISGVPATTPKKFFKRCVEHYATVRHFKHHVIYLAYSLEQLAWIQDSIEDHPFTVCIPRQRIRFLNKKGDPQRSPTHSNAFIYFGSEHEKFRRVFPGLHLTRGTPDADYTVL